MIVFHVYVDAESFDSFEGLDIACMTEPSGTLVITDNKRLVAAYAAGSWKVVLRAN